ncbi:hypothetical protein FRC03_002731 [Tulasnella sp. 419]|nr:hypothetical protein FRC03_002731 [Tulasnella sp. 419]
MAPAESLANIKGDEPAVSQKADVTDSTISGQASKESPENPALTEHPAENTTATSATVVGQPKREVIVRKEIIQLENSDDEDEDDGEEGVSEETVGGMLADYPDDSEELELIHSRLTSLTALNLPRFAGSLKKLCLRQNFITVLEPSDFHPLVNLEELDLYDNKMKHLGEALENCSKLGVLDFSFNLLRSVPDTISNLQSLRTIYFVQNKITKIDHLHHFGATLRSLELGGNRIRTIENLDALVNLEELWLGKNKIAKLQNLSHLRSLRILSIQSNRLVKLEGLESLANLEEIYLSHNGILRLEGLDNNLKLRTIDLGSNRIPKIENVSHLGDLEEFWINDNQIPNLHDLTPQLGSLTALQTIYLEGNPCQRDDMANYRRKVMLALPQLSQIDAIYVRKA